MVYEPVESDEVYAQAGYSSDLGQQGVYALDGSKFVPNRSGRREGLNARSYAACSEWTKGRENIFQKVKMKIQRFETNTSTEDDASFNISFRKPMDFEKNAFSILIGPNGTRKSRTLREIIDLSILRSRDDGFTHVGKLGQLTFWRHDKTSEVPVISKILAISGVATDRFPSRIANKRMKALPLTYGYVGPRSDNNLVSRTQSINQIARSLLAQADLIDSRRENLRHAFKLLELANGILFTLIPSEAHSGTIWTEGELSARYWSAQDDANLDDDSIEVGIFKRGLEILKRKRFSELRLDLDDEDCISTTPGDLKALSVLMITGALSVSESYVLTPKDQKISLSDFSSGQWHVLSSLLFAAIAVGDNSLVLIDEPENSLHPAWQQQFLPLLESTISCAKGVHVLVATHSPLVAASLSSEDAEVFKLSLARGRLQAHRLRAGPYGWTADEILQEVFGLHSTRSVTFTKKMDRALALLAKGDRTNHQLVGLVESLEKTLRTLPDDDVAKEIIKTMVSVVGDPESNG
ncbi:ATP-binding protein [Variovorax boronicumulans]|uniref:ATP-binding protein n=1 Tax=Variovorax boronicumulans TaxID=436515 RepID=UPI001330068A|nr:ATP-binding protein [Variovorax boronicumulans]